MRSFEAFGMMIVVVVANLFGVWFGIAMGLDQCAQNGEYKHKMLAVTIECKVKK